VVPDLIAATIELTIDTVTLMAQIAIPMVAATALTCLRQAGAHQGDERQQLKTAAIAFSSRSSREYRSSVHSPASTQHPYYG
jgi:hypothetical protein